MSDVEEGKICAILMYVFWLVGIIWFFADEKMRKNNFAKFHAQQSIVLVIVSIAFSIVYSIIYFILSAILAMIPVVGWIIIMLLGLGYFLPMIFVIFGLVYAVKGEQKELPLIGRFGDKFKL